MTDIKKDNKDTFRVLAIYTDGLFGNDIDIEAPNKQKYQIAVDKSIELDKELIGKYIELKHTKDENRYYFKHINYKIG